MANPEHLEILKQGVGAWNDWRKANPDVEPDLQEANLSKVDLSKADLSKANLTEAILNGANLSKANLSEADLFIANLTEAKLTEAILTGATLSWAKLFMANLFMANLSGADLTRANLSKADLKGASLSHTKLWMANLNGADLSRANLFMAELSKANLTGAGLSEANLTEANLSGANLSGADLSEANLTEASLTGANLTRANLYGADLSRADLNGANLLGANFYGADLSEANLTEADLSNADFIGANLSNADLTGANLKNCRFSSRSQLNQLKTPLAPGQDTEAVFVDEAGFYKKWKDKTQTIAGPGSFAAAPALRIHVTGPPLTAIEWSAILFCLQIAFNRIQYLTTTEDAFDVVEKEIAGPCFPEDPERALRLLGVEKGSVNIDGGFALQVLSKKENRIIICVALIFGAAYAAACTFNEVADGISKLRASDPAQIVLPDPSRPDEAEPETSPAPMDQETAPVPFNTHPLMVSLPQINTEEIKEHLTIPQSVRNALGDKADLLPGALREFIALQTKLISQGVKMEFTTRNIDKTDIEDA
ncbi:MAG: pentapeptide repeat-containing protein [Pseudomonadota bacterium]